MSRNDEDAAAGNGMDRASMIMAGLDRLDDQYQEMKETQAALLQALEKLQKEESSLEKALTISQQQTKPPQRPKKKDNAAVQRLQEALMNAEDSEDSDEDSSS